ncbi:MAG TPA: peptidylprolyl isomerase [Pyrinomonadaceae bacterium]|nr:peptidylprolyl isomerase [Pyrinomonadaceae bacterium]
MFLAIRFKCLALCALCLVCVAHAQQQQPPQQPGAQKQQPGAQANTGAASKKANSRPASEAATPAGEPFDKATVERMSAQCVKLETTAGTIDLEMLAEVAPESVRNFLNLAATGAYDTTTFSRVVRGFIIQGGDLATREKVTLEWMRRASRTVPDEPNAVKHLRGAVSMARTDMPNSATTHFFILTGDAPHLDGTFSVFGRVRSGMEVVDDINKAEVEGQKPKEPVRIMRATVAACPPAAPPEPKKP